ncbi:MAG: flagellar biosynthesis protein FlhF [Sulfuricella sp.]|nr:flagellar biosynthesis protein FlhF [Sulfuricella sp.]
MNVKKVVAATAREALRRVRETLGPDAVILSNRSVEGGVEILALASNEISGAATTAEALPRNARAGHSEAAADAAAARTAVDAGFSSSIISEIKSMRGLLEQQLAGFAWGDMQRREPAKARIMRDILRAGFSPALSRQLLEKMPAGCDEEQGAKWVRAALANNLRTMNDENAILDQGGVYALMGPTGVGKTTTTAKLAARCVVRHGADKVALLTTDSYRIGAREQLRIYGKILGVTVHAVTDAEDLRLTLEELRNKHMVLIDTVGMSQRDKLVAEQVAMLCGCGDVKRLLLLNATCNGDTLEEVVRAYQGGSVSGCIITKADEAAGIGIVLDVIVRHRLKLYYMANGQRVPEDLHLANRQYLLHRAFKLVSQDSPYRLHDAEHPLVMAEPGHQAGMPAFDLASLNIPGAGFATGASLG